MLVALQAEFITPETLPLLLVTAGLLISLAEAIAPGANFIVVGIALLGAGLVGLALGPLASPFLLGILVLVFGAVAFYGYHELDIYGGKGQAQTSDSKSLRGKTGRVTERVTRSSGEIKLDSGGFNPYYSARALDSEIPEGEEVIVVDPGGGNVLTVEAMGVIETDEIDRELEAGRRRAEREAAERTERETAERTDRERDVDAERTDREPAFETD